MAKVAEPHALTAIDEAQRRATCTHCGPVKIFRCGSGWRCSKAHAEYKRKKRAEDKEKRWLSTALRTKMICCGAPVELPALDSSVLFGDGIARMEVVIHCACGEWKGISRLHFRHDNSDRLTWVDADEYHVNGVRKYVTRADRFERSFFVDLWSI